MGVGWNLTFCVGCKHVTFRMHPVVLTAIRFCLERLGVVQAEDHPALVIRVFWRYAPRTAIPASRWCDLL